MAGPKKLSPSVVRKIFQSTDSAPATAKRFKVSANLVYLIKGGRIHKDVTMALGNPGMTKRDKGGGRRAAGAGAGTGIDAERLADAISERVVEELVRRLRR
jgi:hypothetical protein